MKQLRVRARTVLTPVLATGLCLLGACGIDPPPATGTSAQEATAPAPVGLKPTQVNGLQLPKENGGTAKCNIETLGGQLLEGEHPSITAGRLVPIAGWYAAPAADAAVAPGATDAAAAGDVAPSAPTATTGEAPPADAPATKVAATGYQLVMASENGAQHWTVPLPALGDRPDVAQFLGMPAALKSGFAMDLDLSGLKAGFYSVYVTDSNHSDASVCGLGRGFVIK